MLAFIGRRVVAGVILLFVVAAIPFAMLYADSGSIARRLMGQNATQDLVDRKTAELGLDNPAWVQFGDWLAQTFTGDLGTSWFNGQNVAQTLALRLPVSLSVVIGATVLAAV